MAEQMQADGTYVEVSDAEDEASGGEVEKNARLMGWVSKEEFKGPESSWIDAEEFYQRGTQIMPMLQKNNERLLRNMEATNARLSTTESALRAATAALDAIEEARADDAQAEIKELRSALVAEIARASADGDHAGLAAATAKLTELSEAPPAKVGKKAGDGADDAQYREHPEVTRWFKDNPDYMERPVRERVLAEGIAREMRAAGDTRVGKVFLDDVVGELDKTLGRGDNGGVSKVAAGNGGGARRGAGGSVLKTYADLPADARAACDKMVPRLVGEGKKHKDVGSWRKSYAAKYFEGDAT